MRELDSINSYIWSRSNSAVVCLPCYGKLRNQLNSLNETSYEQLLIKLRNPESKEDREEMIKAIQQGLGAYYRRMVTIRDYYSNQRALWDIDTLLGLIFLGLASMTLFLCYFQLRSSTHSMLLQDSKQISFLRAMGLTGRQI